MNDKMEQEETQVDSNNENVKNQSQTEETKTVRKSKRLSIVPNKYVGKKSQTKETVEFKVGDSCEACDQNKKWYKCRVIQIEENRVKIHFCGWNSRYDKWLEKNSNEIRHDKKIVTPKIVESSEISEAKSHIKLENGICVMAKWTDETFYPAKIARYLIKSEIPYYEVKFLDGLRKTVRFNNLREPIESELYLFNKPENIINETSEKISEEKNKSEEDEKRRAEAELLLAIQEPVLKVESPKIIEENNQEIEKKTEEKPIENTPEQNNIRKSLRVKRLRTFTEEIVFDSPASSISYNLSSMRREKTPEPKRIKPDETEKEKEENRRKVQNYFKSLKLFKSNKKIRNENKMPETEREESEEERRKRKKMKKDKRKLFEELIRNSKLQLERQQQLIAKQLEEHSLKKSQKKLQKLLKKQKEKELLNLQQNLQQNQIEFPDETDLINNLPICCTFENCTKTFRKQSLLDYHLKYHHYIGSNAPKPEATGQKKTNKTKKKKINDEIDDYSYGHSLKSDEETDPYEVIHCKCGNNISKGFMIQCEICLCWQHGNCENILSNSQVPESYLCWVCNEPANNLKNLKYQSWMKTSLERELKMKEAKPEEVKRIRLLNDCSKQYYGLNLLMYTLEFQMSLFNQLVNKNRPDGEIIEQSVDNNNNNSNGNNNELEHDEESYDQLDRLSQNIAHLQDCIVKQFNEFNSKLDEYESNYPTDDNSDIQNFNIEQLYNQLQSIL